MNRTLIYLIAFLAFIGISDTASANACLCAGACTTSASTNWTSCGGTFPGSADSFEVQSGGTVTINSSPSYTYGIVDANGTLKCNDDTTARTVTFTSTNNGPVGGTWPAALWVKAGGTLDCDGATGVEGEDIQFIYNGTVPSLGANFFFGDSLIVAINTTTDATVKLRGLRRSSSTNWSGNTSIDSFDQGTTTTDFIYCAKLVGGLGTVSANDTAVFTSGRLTDYWCKVTNVTPNTAECPNTQCSGGQCDVQLDCNNSDREYLSMTKVANLGGPARHATPDDGDADGTADNTILFPSNGDAVELFKMSRIKGSGDEAAGGTSAITLGARIIFGGVQANMRYLEFDDLTEGPSAASCTAGVGTLCGGGSSIHIELMSTTPASEGDFSFVNIHDWASTNTVEANATDRTDDSRSNYPLIRRHWYEHDPDQDIPATCNCGSVSQKIGMGEGITVDQGDKMTEANTLMSGFHIARTYGPPIVAFGPQASGGAAQWTGNRYEKLLLHDWPGSATYGAAGATFYLADGTDTQINGINIWDVGSSSVTASAIDLTPIATNTTPTSLNSIRVTNAYIVNVDANSTGSNGQAIVDMTRNVTTPYNTETSGLRLSNSYISNVVGDATRGGSVYFSFFNNAFLANTGTCTTVNDIRTAILDPVDAIGNYIMRDNSLSCFSRGIGWVEFGAVDSHLYTTRTRKIISNVVSGMVTTTSFMPVGIGLRATSNAITGDFDLYNNIIDLKQAATTPGDEYAIFFFCNTSACNNRITGFYNVMMNSTYRGVRVVQPASGSVTYDFNYNIFHRIGTYAANYNNSGSFYDGESAIHSHDTLNNNADFLLEPASSLYTLDCRSTFRTGTAYGGTQGSLRYGINSFEYFHPASIATMNSAVFKARSDWRDCSSSYIDSVPR